MCVLGANKLPEEKEVEMVELEGSHGTTQSRAQGIEAEGFNIGGDNYLGAGVYFFHRENDGTAFAYKWYCTAKGLGAYFPDEDDSCVVVHASIRCNSNNYFDVTHPTVLELYRKLSSVLTGRKFTITQKNRIRDKWLKAFERRQGEQIKVLNAPIPLSKYFKPTKESECIVVKDVDCIQQPYSLEKYDED